MKLQVRLLGAYRECLPSDAQGSTYSLEIPVGTRIEELHAYVSVPADERQVILVNGQTPIVGQALEENDTVAIFPAMAGG
jgi:molybdopterin converting factor small subunit